MQAETARTRPRFIFNPERFAAGGVGRALLEATRDHGTATGAKRLVVSTAATNREARALYESCGYKQEDVFPAYKLDL